MIWNELKQLQCKKSVMPTASSMRMKGVRVMMEQQYKK
jgi:hypothetical protein